MAPRACSPTGRRHFPQKESSVRSNRTRRTNSLARLAQTVEAAPSKRAEVSVRIRERAPGSLRQAAKASRLHRDIRRFESVREHQSNSKHASESEKRGPRPITAWQEGQYLPLAPIRTRSLKPEWRGSGLLTRRHVDRNHSRPPTDCWPRGQAPDS